MPALVEFGATNWNHWARTNIEPLVTASRALFGQKSRPSLVAIAFIISATTAVPSAHAQGGDIESRAGFIHRKTPYAVDGLALGEKVIFGSKVYSQYKCDPSQLFQGATWCVRKQAEVGPHGQFNSSISILHNPDGAAVYVSKFIEPAVFGSNEANSEIERLTRKFGARPIIKVLPKRPGLPNAIIAVWGDISLVPIDAASTQLLASGKSPQNGILIDYMGNFRHSAQEGLPIYRLAGTAAGYIWSASFDQTGLGNLRFLAFDNSLIETANQSTDFTGARPPALETNSAAAFLVADAESRERSKQLAEQSELQARQRNQVVEPVEAAALKQKKDAEIADADGIKSQQTGGFLVQAQSGDLELELRSLTCDEFVPSKLSLLRQDANLFDIPEIEWTRDLFGVLRERALSCAASASPSDRAFVRSWLKLKEETILIRAANAVRERDTAIQNQHQAAVAVERRQAEAAAREQASKIQEAERAEAALEASALEARRKAEVAASEEELVRRTAEIKAMPDTPENIEKLRSMTYDKITAIKSLSFPQHNTLYQVIGSKLSSMEAHLIEATTETKCSRLVKPIGIPKELDGILLVYPIDESMTLNRFLCAVAAAGGKPQVSTGWFDKTSVQVQFNNGTILKFSQGRILPGNGEFIAASSPVTGGEAALLITTVTAPNSQEETTDPRLLMGLFWKFNPALVAFLAQK